MKDQYDKLGPGRFSEDYVPERRSIPPARWPVADRLAWERARGPGCEFELPGPAALWAAETCRARLQAYGRYLNFLQRNGLLFAAEGPSNRLLPDRIRAYIAEAKQWVSPHTVDQILVELYRFACAITPDADWDWIRRHPSRPSRAEIRASKPKKDVFEPKILLCKALDFMDGLYSGPPTYEDCLRYRDALIVAMQCGFALRRRNLVGMTLGRNLVVDGDVVHLIFRAEETKNYRPIRWTVPGYLKPYLLRYLEVHRAILLDGNLCDAVWINGRHKALQYGGLPTLFNSAGRRFLGYPITCHWFRHSLATAILTNDPRKIRLAGGALSHNSIATVNRHYDMSGDAASRRVWERLRKEIVRGKRDYHS
jgi:integrase/recombinase XerD